MLNSSPSEYRQTVRIIRSAELTIQYLTYRVNGVNFIQINHIAKLTEMPNQKDYLTYGVNGVCLEKLYELTVVPN